MIWRFNANNLEWLQYFYANSFVSKVKWSYSYEWGILYEQNLRNYILIFCKNTIIPNFKYAKYHYLLILIYFIDIKSTHKTSGATLMFVVIFVFSIVFCNLFGVCSFEGKSVFHIKSGSCSRWSTVKGRGSSPSQFASFPFIKIFVKSQIPCFRLNLI